MGVLIATGGAASAVAQITLTEKVFRVRVVRAGLAGVRHRSAPYVLPGRIESLDRGPAVPRQAGAGEAVPHRIDGLIHPFREPIQVVYPPPLGAGIATLISPAWVRGMV
jgi:hypothetical protein